MGLSSTPLPSPIPHSQVDSQVDDSTNVCSDDDEDTLRRVMRSFGTKSFYFGDAGHGGDSESCSDDECSTNDDIAYLQRLQEQFLPASAVPSASSVPDTPPIVNPVRAFPPPDTDDDDDFETLHAIQRRFACYGGGATINDFSPETCSAVSVELSEEDPHNLFSTLMVYEAGSESTNKSLDAPIVVSPITSLMNTETYRDFPDHNHKYNEDGLCSISARQFISSKFPKSVQNFVDALKKNRSYQRFIRAKLVEIEAKMEVNRKLKERIKCLMDFRTAYRRKLGSGLYQKRDPRVRLISLRKERSSRTVKDNSNNSSAVYFSPEENPQVSNYKMVMRRFPVSHRERQWSNAEKGEILKGVKQQYQEILFLNCMNLGSDFNGSIDSIIKSTIDNANQQATPEILRSFLPLVNWDRLASMYLPSRSGPSCQSRFLNHEDPMINHNPWTLSEDKKLLFIVQERGLYNWIEIAVTLRTNRTPFQCLARYQRSLNPHILNREWTKEEDTKLYATVETFGDNNWQIVASHLDGRTSNQCSIRWRNSLLPERKRVGRWSVEEDKRLKVSVILFGAKNWKKIAQFVPGRTQIQCRERWLNCLDPSLNLEGWTEEEDSNLLSAIAEHGHSWSKVATHIPGRTDNHCRRRWKSLLPHEVPKLKAAQQLKKTVLISNFVGRESERPALGPNDFTPIMSLVTPNMENFTKVRKKRSREQSKPTNKMKASRKKQPRKSRAIIEKDGEKKSTEGLARKKQSRKSRAIIEKDGEKKSTEGLVITAEENLREDLVIIADNLPLETFTPIVSEISRNKRPRKRIKEKNNTESLELRPKEMTKEIQ